MDYKITGKQIDIGTALQEHVQDSLDLILDKYNLRPTAATVVFSRDAHEFVAECILQFSSGLKSAAKAHATEIYSAFEASSEKLSKQMRRYKRRLKNHHQTRSIPVDQLDARSYILSNESESDEAEPEGFDPIIIAETDTVCPTLSVGEAVMQMDLMAANVMVFKNEKTNGLNVVYRREDGNVGWIEPSSS